MKGLVASRQSGDKWYKSPRWARIRRHQLLEHPLCAFCLERGIVIPAEICDHVEPHYGDVNKFWLGPFQSALQALPRLHRNDWSNCVGFARILVTMAGRCSRAVAIRCEWRTHSVKRFIRAPRTSAARRDDEVSLLKGRQL